MILSFDLQQILLQILVFIACGGLVAALVLPFFVNAGAEDRVRTAAGRWSSLQTAKQAAASGLVANQKDDRRQQIQEAIDQFEETERKRRQRVTLRVLIAQAGLEISVRRFWIASAVVGIIAAAFALFLNAPIYLVLLSGVVGLLGLPRWFLAFLRRRRRNAFVNQLADAIDVMVRGLRAGLPVTEALKLIAEELGPPVGPEFMRVVDGLRLGLTIEQGVDRMHERIPAPEVNILSIAFGIQSRTGGNMSETLSNLSTMLRERKKMKGKVHAMSQEAKSSAAIIGALPFVVTAMLYFINPSHIKPLLDTETGHMMLGIAGLWMLVGILVMRKMIQFEI